jgi:hypothetical protein
MAAVMGACFLLEMLYGVKSMLKNHAADAVVYTVECLLENYTANNI